VNWLDMMLLIPIALFAWRGFSNGIVGEVLGIAGLIVSVFLTFAYMKPAAALFEPYFDTADYAVIAAGTVIFVGTLIVFQLAAWLLKSILKLAKLNLVNRLAGLGFGVLKAAVVLSAALLLLAGFRLPPEQIRKESVLYPVVTPVAPVVYDAVALVWPGVEGFKETMEEALDQSNPLRLLPFLNPDESGRGSGRDSGRGSGRDSGRDAERNLDDGSMVRMGWNGFEGTAVTEQVGRSDCDGRNIMWHKV
jgi:membrane protein required for colicin V production